MHDIFLLQDGQQRIGQADTSSRGDAVEAAAGFAL
jgi:hypothetical protein